MMPQQLVHLDEWQQVCVYACVFTLTFGLGVAGSTSMYYSP